MSAAYVWPVLMVLTILATPVGVAFMAWRERVGECDTRHTESPYSAARHRASVLVSSTTTDRATYPAETE